MSKPSVLFSPVWPQKLTAMRLKNGRTFFDPTMGRMKHCARCDEHWPADSEFFYTIPKNKDGLDGWCKACHREFKAGLGAYKLNNEFH